MTDVLIGFVLSLALVILSLTGWYSIKDLAATFLRTSATPSRCLPSLLPEYMIASPLFVIFYCMTLDARKVSWILRETRSDEHETGSYC